TLNQVAPPQRLQRLQHLALERRPSQVGQQRVQRGQVARDRQPQQQSLLQRRRADVLHREELADAVEKRVALLQERRDGAAEDLPDRLPYQLERQRVAAVQMR